MTDIVMIALLLFLSLVSGAALSLICLLKFGDYREMMDEEPQECSIPLNSAADNVSEQEKILEEWVYGAGAKSR